MINKNMQTKDSETQCVFPTNSFFIISPYSLLKNKQSGHQQLIGLDFSNKQQCQMIWALFTKKQNSVVMSFTLPVWPNGTNHLASPALSLLSSTRSPIFTLFTLKRSYLPACSSFDKRLSPNRPLCTDAHSAQIPYVNPLCDKPDERKINAPASVIRS